LQRARQGEGPAPGTVGALETQPRDSRAARLLGRSGSNPAERTIFSKREAPSPSWRSARFHLASLISSGMGCACARAKPVARRVSSNSKRRRDSKGGTRRSRSGDRSYNHPPSPCGSRRPAAICQVAIRRSLPWPTLPAELGIHPVSTLPPNGPILGADKPPPLVVKLPLIRAPP